MKKIVRLTESDLKRVIKKILNEEVSSMDRTFNSDENHSYNSKVKDFLLVKFNEKGDEIIDVKNGRTSYASIFEKNEELQHETIKIVEKRGLVYIKYRGNLKDSLSDTFNEVYIEISKHPKLSRKIMVAFEKGDNEELQELVFSIPFHWDDKF